MRAMHAGWGVRERTGEQGSLNPAGGGTGGVQAHLRRLLVKPLGLFSKTG